MRRIVVLNNLPSKFSVQDFEEKLAELGYPSTYSVAYGDIMKLYGEGKIKRDDTVLTYRKNTNRPLFVWTKVEQREGNGEGIPCPECGGDSIVDGYRETKQGTKQRRECKKCKTHFTVPCSVARRLIPRAKLETPKTKKFNKPIQIQSKILKLYASGLKNYSGIARQIGVDPRTVKRYIENLYQKPQTETLVEPEKKGVLKTEPAVPSLQEEAVSLPLTPYMITAGRIVEEKVAMRRDAVMDILPPKFTILDYIDKMRELNFHATKNMAWGDLLNLEQDKKIRRIGTLPIPGTATPAVLWTKTEPEKEEKSRATTEPLSKELKQHWETAQEIEQPFTLGDYKRKLILRGEYMPRDKGFQELKTFEEEGMLKLVGKEPFRWQKIERKTTEEVEILERDGFIKDTLAKDRKVIESVIRERTKI